MPDKISGIDFDPGFRLDYDDFEQGIINRDPYYQEWLRPTGLHWHANAGSR
jgi:hypothetical protein